MFTWNMMFYLFDILFFFLLVMPPNLYPNLQVSTVVPTSYVIFSNEFKGIL